jgi:RNA polymerase sigma-70 factor, ECF subfamily
MNQAAITDQQLVMRLRAGDEEAFIELVHRHHAPLIRLARTFVDRTDIAEDVAQETWLAMLTGIDRFEGRSSLRTWLYQICLNRARTIGAREHRAVPTDLIGPAVEAEQFTPTGTWTSPPTPWPASPNGPFDDGDLVAAIRDAITELPNMQQPVVTMRDVDGLSGAEVCHVLSISEANHRVLLHRGRNQIRRSVDAMVRNR